MKAARCSCFLGLFLCACFPYFKQIESDKKKFQERFPSADVFYETGGRRMHLVKAGDGPDTVVFVHGSPGSWDAFAGFLLDDELLSRARLLSFDRPGFGLSDPGVPELLLERQSALILEGIRRERRGRVILVGHSLGGPVIARIAMDAPDEIDSLIFLAASVDPQLETVHWYQNLADYRAVRAAIPEAIDVTNQEILPLAAELTKMLPLYPRIRSRVLVIQGEKDDLVPPGNADFLAKQLPVSRVTRVPDLNHFIPWARPDLVKSAILEALAGN